MNIFFSLSSMLNKLIDMDCILNLCSSTAVQIETSAVVFMIRFHHCGQVLIINKIFYCNQSCRPITFMHLI